MNRRMEDLSEMGGKETTADGIRPTRRQVLKAAAVMSGSVAIPRVSQPRTSGQKLTFLNWEQTEGTPLGDAIKRWEKKTGNNVTIQVQPSGNTYDIKMQTTLAAANPPDVMRLNDSYIRGFSAGHYLFDLKKQVAQVKASDYFASSFDFPRQPDGRYTAWVIGSIPRVLFCNLSLFKSAGVSLPPATWTGQGWGWNDFLKTAQKLTKKGDHWGTLIYTDTGYYEAFARNNGGPGTYSTDGKTFALADAAGSQAVQWVTDLATRHSVQPPWDQLQTTGIGNQLFAQGKIAMLHTSMGNIPYFRENVKDFDWDVRPIPAGKAMQTTVPSLVIFTIPAHAKNHALAWDLLKYLGSQEGGTVLAQGADLIPINKKAAAKLKATKLPPKHINLFVPANEHGVLPHVEQYELQSRNIWRPALEDVYNGKAQAATVLQRVKPQVDAALAGQ